MLAAVWLLVFSGSLHAAVSVTNTAPDPSSVILSSASIAASGSTAYSKSSTTDQFGGVAFTLTSDISLNAVAFYIHAVGNGVTNANFTFSIVEFTTGIPPHTTITETNPVTSTYTYTTIYSEAMTMLASMPVNNYVTFSFTNFVNLDADKTYGTLLHFTAAASQQSINFRNTSTNDTNFSSYRTTLNDAGDYVYFVSSTETYFAIIPEPTTLAALLAGFGLIGGVLWKRSRHG